MKILDKYQYTCNNCGNEWYSKKKIKIIKDIQNHKELDPVVLDPVVFDLQENIIKNPDGTIKTIELKVIEIKNKTEESINKNNQQYLKLDKCPKCIIDKKEADSYRKKNKLKEMPVEKKLKQ